MAIAPTTKKYKLGDPVRIQFGVNFVDGKIIEKRGPIGVGRQDVYTVEFNFGADEPYQIDLPADKIEAGRQR